MRPFLAALALAALPALPALADGLIVVPPHPPEMPHLRNVPLRVRTHAVTVKVDARVAVTEVDQVFVNPNPRQLEGTYLFPLPEGATIDRFSMWIDGNEVGAELLDAAKARSIYEGIVRSMRDPALLEYADRGLFKARVFPIEANGEKRVKIRYAEVLAADNGTVGYRYPLATERFSSAPLESVSIDVTIQGAGPIASLWSPSHRIETQPVPSGIDGQARWSARGALPDRDFLLYWRPTAKDVAVTVLAHRDAADPEGTFLLLFAPRPAADLPAMPKDVIFVVDTSGSMAGAKMEQARGALRYCLRSLGAQDRFALVPFSTEPRPFRDALVDASAENRAAAERFVDELSAAGGTAIDDALRVGLDMLPSPAPQGRPSIVLFVTDGLPTIGETDVGKILGNAASRAGAARVFAFGVGDDVNTRLLDRLAEENRGARDYVSSAESIEEKVSNLYAKLAKPAMTDLALSIDGVATSAVHPHRLPDLFHGGEVLVAGRFAKPGNAVIRLKGRVGGAEREIVEEVRFPETETRHAFLPRLWAVRRVGFLLQQMRVSGESAEVKDEVVRLAKRFGIVTPYTSYLIVEDERRTPVSGGGAGGRAGPATPGFALDGADAGGAEAPAAETAARAESAEAARRAGKAKKAESGEGAVGLSRELLDLTRFEGEKDADARDDAAERLVRHLAGRTFVASGGVWLDSSLDLGKTRRTVEAFSDAYFELVRAHPEVAPWLALGRVAFAVGDEVVEIVPAR